MDSDKTILRANGLRWLGRLSILVIVVLSLLPGGWQAHTGAPGPLEHFAAYLLAAAVVGLGQPAGKPVVWTVIGFAALAGLMEILQNFSPHRDPKVIDFLASTGGAVVGTLIAIYLPALLRGRL